MSVGKNIISLENYTKKSHFHFSSVCSPTVSGLGFSGGFWVDGELGFWSRRGGGAVSLGFGVGSSSRGSPVCRGFEVGLGFWISARWWAVGLLWVWVCLPWDCRGSWESTAKK